MPRFLSLFALLALAAAARAANKPNDVIVLADDQGWGDLSVHGNTNLPTPHIDSLAKAGAMPDRFYEKLSADNLKLRGRKPAAEDTGFTRAALAMCENVDWNVGRILERLDELKLADNTIVLYFSDSRLQGKVSQPNDPPALGAEHDRVPRNDESYVKDFQPLRLGVIELKSGHGPLTLRALTVPGKQVMEIRQVTLTLLKP